MIYFQGLALLAIGGLQTNTINRRLDAMDMYPPLVTVQEQRISRLEETMEEEDLGSLRQEVVSNREASQEIQRTVFNNTLTIRTACQNVSGSSKTYLLCEDLTI